MAAGLLASCTAEDCNPVSSKLPPVDAGGKYTEIMVSINRNGTKDGHTTVRFYEGLEGIPYISLSEFYKVIDLPGSMRVRRQGDNYLLTTRSGTAIVDVVDDKLTTTDFLSFFSLVPLHDASMPALSSWDGMPFLKPAGQLFLPEGTTTTFDFKKYHIDLHDEGGQVFAPYTILANIFNDSFWDTSYYNDDKQELVVNNGFLNGYDFDADEKTDPDRIQRIYGRKELTDAQAQFRYNQLCFVFDYMYGCPDRDNELHRAGIEQLGFDAALDNARGGATVKKLLKQKDNAAFMVGLDALQMMVYDGAVTNMFQYPYATQVSGVEARYLDCFEQNPDAMDLIIEWSNLNMESSEYMNKMYALRQESYGDKRYITSSDKQTAVVVLDDLFTLDTEGWKAYYKSPKKEADLQALLARNGDAVEALINALRQARIDGVKNLVLDLTMSRGGSSDELLGILSLTARKEAERKQVSFYFESRVSQQKILNLFCMDRNLDGRFDEADELVDNNDLNIVVLTSNSTVSIPNMLAALMKEQGFKIMGQRADGGNCSSMIFYTVDGMKYAISGGRTHFWADTTDPLDRGVAIDIDVPLEKFYDIDYLSGLLQGGN